MTSHRAPRGHRRSPRRVSGRAKAVIALGAVAAVAVGFSTTGTFAYFTDQATAQTGSFTAGTLDITLNGLLAGTANNPGSTTLASFTLANMVPGESMSNLIAVANNGSVPLTYTISGSATAGGLTPVMTYSVYAGSTAAPSSGTIAAGNRTGTCTGGTALATNQTLATTATVLAGTARSLTAAGSGSTAAENICVIATLPTSADNTYQGLSTTASFIFNAKQVSAP